MFLKLKTYRKDDISSSIPLCNHPSFLSWKKRPTTECDVRQLARTRQITQTQWCVTAPRACACLWVCNKGLGRHAGSRHAASIANTSTHAPNGGHYSFVGLCVFLFACIDVCKLTACTGHLWWICCLILLLKETWLQIILFTSIYPIVHRSWRKDEQEEKVDVHLFYPINY